MVMDAKILEDIGLTKGESKVYLALLLLGQTTTGPIVKKSGVTTSKSYKILDRLEEKGLVSHVYKNKVKHFKSAPPDKILALVNKQYLDVEKRKKEVERIIPELIKYQQLRTLNKGEASYVIGITNFQDYPKNIAEFFRLLQLKRDRKGVKSYFLLSEEARGTFEYMKKSKCSFLRHIPYASLVSINIYKDITIIGVFLARPILFKIKSKEVADTFMKYFHILWEQGRE